MVRRLGACGDSGGRHPGCCATAERRCRDCARRTSRRRHAGAYEARKVYRRARVPVPPRHLKEPPADASTTEPAAGSVSACPARPACGACRTEPSQPGGTMRASTPDPVDEPERRKLSGTAVRDEDRVHRALRASLALAREWDRRWRRRRDRWQRRRRPAVWHEMRSPRVLWWPGRRYAGVSTRKDRVASRFVAPVR